MQNRHLWDLFNFRKDFPGITTVNKHQHCIELSSVLFIFRAYVVNEIRFYSLLPDQHLHLSSVMNGVIVQLQRNVDQSCLLSPSIITGKFHLFKYLFLSFVL